MADKLMRIISEKITPEVSHNGFSIEQKIELFDKLEAELIRIFYKKNFAHYFDIRTNHLNEKDWRRSFSINQMLYGMILYATADRTLHNSFDEIIPILKKLYGTTDTNESVSDWR